MAVNIQPETILLVDDCEDDVFFFKRMLRRAGLDHPVVVVPNAQEAMDLLHGEDESEFDNFCAILTELHLPCETGLDLIKWIRAQSHLEGLPIIVLTASIWEKEVELASELGVNKVFHKTCNPDDLHDVVDYIAELSGHATCDSKGQITASKSASHDDASELLGTLSARLK